MGVINTFILNLHSLFGWVNAHRHGKVILSEGNFFYESVELLYVTTYSTLSHLYDAVLTNQR